MADNYEGGADFKIPADWILEIAQLKSVARDASLNAIGDYDPYPKQRQFHKEGATSRERALVAANQVGKCISYNTLIEHPDGTSTKAGVLFERKCRFKVNAWDGEKVVEAWATNAIKKPAEMCYKVYLSNGKWFEAAANHRVLTVSGYSFLGDLLQSVPCHLQSNSEFYPSIRGQGVLRWIGSKLSFLVNCRLSRHLCGGLLRLGANIGQVFSPLLNDVRKHSFASCGSDGLVNKYKDIRQHTSFRLSNQGGAHLSGGRNAGLGLHVFCKGDLLSHESKIKFLRLRAVVADLLRSISLVKPSQYYASSLVSPSNKSNQIIAYSLVGVQDIYDFTVPVYQNYITSGVVHHNTFSAAAEVSYHLTGLYPDWWEGKVFTKGNNWLAGSESGELTKKGIQRLLFGRDIRTELGTGMIPASCIVDHVMARGVPDLIDTVRVRHKSGSMSSISLKSYEQGRSKWQADTVDGIWFDEEPPEEVYTEGLTRTNTTMGPIILTETPLMGNTRVIARFMGSDKAPNTCVINMTIDDALHYTKEQREAIIASYPAHEREARTKGIPMRGSGAVFPIAESSITCSPITIPTDWPQIIGLDFGIDHPTAAANLAWDRDTDTIYVTHVYRKKDVTPVLVAPALLAWGDWKSVAWPHDGLNRDKGSGQQLAQIFADAGLRMLPEKATFPDGGNGFEAGIMEMMTRMQTNKFKVFDTCWEFFEEFRMYHRKDGLVVKVLDDVISAIRYGIMMIRYAKPSRAIAVKKKMFGFRSPSSNSWMGA